MFWGLIYFGDSGRRNNNRNLFVGFLSVNFKTKTAFYHTNIDRIVEKEGGNG